MKENIFIGMSFRVDIENTGVMLLEEMGGWQRYIKVVDLNDVTLKFYQEIYDEAGALIELHEKFPVDTCHQKV